VWCVAAGAFLGTVDWEKMGAPGQGHGHGHGVHAPGKCKFINWIFNGGKANNDEIPDGKAPLLIDENEFEIPDGKAPLLIDDELEADKKKKKTTSKPGFLPIGPGKELLENWQGMKPDTNFKKLVPSTKFISKPEEINDLENEIKAAPLDANFQANFEE